MTDNEILKALELCQLNVFRCGECPLYAYQDCRYRLNGYLLDLTNRQRAETERFVKENHENFHKWEILDNRTKQRYAELYEEAKAIVKAEAIKEFAERLKEQKYQSSDWSHGEHPFVVEESDIDELVQEMVGEEDG